MRNVGDRSTWQVKGANTKPLLKIILQITKPEGQVAELNVKATY